MSVQALSLNPHVDAVETELFEKQKVLSTLVQLWLPTLLTGWQLKLILSALTLSHRLTRTEPTNNYCR